MQFHHDNDNVDDEPCLPTAAHGDEPMRRPDHKAKKHGKPMPVRWRRWPMPDPAGDDRDFDPREVGGDHA